MASLALAKSLPLQTLHAVSNHLFLLPTKHTTLSDFDSESYIDSINISCNVNQ